MNSFSFVAPLLTALLASTAQPARAVESYTKDAPETAGATRANDEQDCAQQDHAYVGFLACTRLLMAKDLDASTKIKLYAARARAELVLFDFAEAVEDFTEVLTAEPDNLAALAGRAEALGQHGKHAKASEDWAHVVKLKGSDLAARMQLGLSLNAANLYDKAVEAFEAFIQLEPNNPEAYIGLARAYEALKNPGKADENLAAALKINPTSNSALMTRAEIAERRGDRELAIESYSQALKANGMQIRPRQALQRLGIETPMPR